MNAHRHTCRPAKYNSLSSEPVIPVDKITEWESDFRTHLTGSQQALLEKISTGNVTPETESEIKKVVEAHVSSFTSA